MEIYSAIEAVVGRAYCINLIDTEDKIYARNQIMSLLALNDFPEQVTINGEFDIPELLDVLIEFAIDKNIIDDLQAEREILSTKIMNIFLPRPSDVNKEFYEKYSVKPVEATNYFYKLSRDSNYIQTRSIAKNINYVTETHYGQLDITINLSKPEKDPRQIAREREMKTPSSHYHYPKCLLCIENEGYEGRVNHPARSNHRIIPLTLANESWYFQYSPYVYYDEHCIILSAEHRDMKIDRGAFSRLLEFVEKFPHYFLGSNADLPIIGGSILTHDHYQGGNYEFAMARAKDDYPFSLRDYPSIQASVVHWPMSVIRLRGKDRDELVDAADMILVRWIDYSDLEVNILAYTEGTRHNTITPIARMRNKQYELDLVLRNNRTNEEHPLGIFHPHKNVQHIKKENIGLIEVMGLAVLPARLATELVEIEKFLLGESQEVREYHLPWAIELQERYGTSINRDSVTEIVRKEVGFKFLRCLEDAGVFKRDEKGQTAFRRFIEQL
ncbi:UDP-glucose--hexose-1-phosphate uridylyltransferase [Tepidibacillus marianensis]|uniref:UDP-glucose--hexose-1-phosphate uridylyltransferase n=1 Tax=Tepidibacillus marianensis TaxID=3131995 RepID=UPI0030D00312